MTRAGLHLVLPGSLQRRTGGTIYDARMVAGLRRRGRSVVVHELVGEFPDADERARASFADALRALPDGETVVIDGLSMSGLPDVVAGHRSRLRQVGLIHMLFADEPGLAPADHKWRQALEHEAFAAVRGVVTTSAYTAARVADLGIPADRIRVVEPGTDRVARAEGPGPGEAPRLLCAAAVTPVKGQDVLVRALGRIADLAWTCTCVGSLDRAPDFVREVRGLIRDADLDDRVELAGEQDESSLGSLYRHSSIVVLPSHHESYGMVLTEAMARGLPVVSTTAGAIPGTVPGAAGILVPPGDVEELAAALRSLLEDAPNEPGGAAQRRQRLGSAGRRHASRLPTWDEAAAGFEDAVSVLAGGAARAGPSWTA